MTGGKECALRPTEMSRLYQLQKQVEPKPMLGATSIVKRLKRAVRNRRRGIFAIFVDRGFNCLIVT